MNDQDIRWVQRFGNFVKAFDQLDEATQLKATRSLSKLEKQGVIQAFAAGLIDDGETWMQMLQDRNRTSHTYNEETAEPILMNVCSGSITPPF